MSVHVSECNRDWASQQCPEKDDAPHIQRLDVADAELIEHLNLAGAEESERNNKLGIGQEVKAKIAQVSLESNPKLKTEPPKKVKEAETPLAEKLLAKIQAIKTEVASLKQDVNCSHAQSPGEESKI